MIFFLLIMLSFLLMGCGKQEIEIKKTGRYVEHRIELFYFCNPLEVSDQGEILAYSLIGYGSYIEKRVLANTSMWVPMRCYDFKYPKDCVNLIKIMENKGNLHILYLNDRGELIAGKCSDTGYIDKHVIKKEKKPLLVNGEANVDFCMDQEDGYIVLIDETVQVVDSKTGEIRYTYPEPCQQIERLEDKIYMLSLQNEGILIYDMNTYQLDRKISIVKQQGDEVFSIDANNGSIFLAGHNGIYHHLLEGSIWEEVIPASHTALAMAGYKLLDFFIAQDKYYVCIQNEAGEIMLMQYEYDSEASSHIEQTIKIVMSKENELIKQAAAIYEAQHPEVQVEWQVLEGNEMEKKTQLDALLKSEAPPDIFVLDDLPISSYIERGWLKDLSRIVAFKKESEKWNETIVETYAENGIYYALPMRYSVPMIWGSETLLSECSSIQELAQYKKRHPQQIVLGKSLQELVMQTAKVSMPLIVDEEGQFNREKCESYLKDLVVLSECSNEESIQPCISIEGIGNEKKTEVLNTAYKETEGFLMTPMRLQDAIWGEMAMNARNDGSVKGLTINGQILYEVNGVLALNARGKHQLTAEEIVSLALGKQVEAINNGEGLPLGTIAIDDQEFYYDIEKSDLVDAVNKDRKLSMVRPFCSVYGEMKMERQKATLCISKEEYTKLYNKIYSYLLAFAKGEMPMEEALDQMEKVANAS